MKEQQLTPPAVQQWYTGFLPLPETPPRLTLVPSAAQPNTELPTAIEEVRAELKAVTAHLMDPGTKGIQASLPHLERAVTVFSGYVKMKQLPILEPAIDALRAELALATLLFENAYTLQAGWAAQLGLNLDGTPKQILYAGPGQTPALPPRPASVTWEG